jgi:hypothetical protein
MMRVSHSGRRIWRVRALTVVLLAPAVAGTASAQSRSIGYSYDAVNRLVEARYPDRVVHYTYDPAGNRLMLTVEIPNPLPVVSSITPAATVAGAGGFALQVAGSQFVASSVVQWNGSARTTSYVSATALSASISAADVAAVGTAAVTVLNPTPGGGVSNELVFTINATQTVPTITWADPAPITLGTALSATQLNATANTEGTFLYDPPAGTILTLGTHTLSTTFTPTDTVNFTTASKSVSIEVVTAAGTASVPSDFNGDGTSDILWRHSTQGDLWLWPMDGAAKQSETFVRTVSDTNWEIRGQGDQNGDGTADILWRNKVTGMIYFWPMSAGAPTAEIYVATVDTAYDIIGTGDFNGDGRSDILWRNSTVGDLWIWLMNDATVLSAVYVDTVDPAYVVEGVGDLDGDAKADLVWHGAAGDVWVWLMNGTARLSQTYVGTVPDPHYQIQQVADFDGNGKADLLWWNTVQGDVWIWPMNGAAVASESYVGVVADTDYRIVGSGDYDGNGMADILWRNVSLGDVWVWLMNGTTKLSENYVGTVPDLGYQVVNR